MLRLVYLLLRQRLTRRRNVRPDPVLAPPDRPSPWLIGAVTGLAVAAGVAIGALVNPRLVPPSGPLRPAASQTAKLEIQVDGIEAPPLVAYIEAPGASVSPAPAPSGRTARITSVNNTFQPQFQVAPLATTLEVGNDDPIAHNTHLYDGQYTLFNVATPVPGLRVQRVLGRPGMYQARCDLHPWMRAWVFVPANRHYQVLWQTGRVVLADIAPGRYRLHLWAPAHGEIIRTLNFAPGEVKSFALSELQSVPAARDRAPASDRLRPKSRHDGG